jgi:hypothetical protein
MVADDAALQQPVSKGEREAVSILGKTYTAVRATPTLPHPHLANPKFCQKHKIAPPTLPYPHLAK